MERELKKRLMNLSEIMSNQYKLKILEDMVVFRLAAITDGDENFDLTPDEVNDNINLIKNWFQMYSCGFPPVDYEFIVNNTDNEY